jgi:hypothetical protein
LAAQRSPSAIDDEDGRLLAALERTHHLLDDAILKEGAQGIGNQHRDRVSITEPGRRAPEAHRVWASAGQDSGGDRRAAAPLAGMLRWRSSRSATRFTHPAAGCHGSSWRARKCLMAGGWWLRRFSGPLGALGQGELREAAGAHRRLERGLVGEDADTRPVRGLAGVGEGLAALG